MALGSFLGLGGKALRGMGKGFSRGPKRMKGKASQMGSRPHASAETASAQTTFGAAGAREHLRDFQGVADDLARQGKQANAIAIALVGFGASTAAASVAAKRAIEKNNPALNRTRKDEED